MASALPHRAFQQQCVSQPLWCSWAAKDSFPAALTSELTSFSTSWTQVEAGAV